MAGRQLVASGVVGARGCRHPRVLVGVSVQGLDHLTRRRAGVEQTARTTAAVPEAATVAGGPAAVRRHPGGPPWAPPNPPGGPPPMPPRPPPGPPPRPPIGPAVGSDPVCGVRAVFSEYAAGATMPTDSAPAATAIAAFRVIHGRASTANAASRPPPSTSGRRYGAQSGLRLRRT